MLTRAQRCDCVCLAAVCAEAYNPDDDEDNDTEPRVVHPKTDEQRHRLQEACRHILLFKTLEQVQQHPEVPVGMGGTGVVFRETGV